MTLLKNDPLTQLAFSIHENKGVFAVLIGSGLSRAAEIPTGWEITLDLIRRVGLAQGIEEQADWALWYRQKTMLEANYSALLEDMAISPEERRSILHSYIEPNAKDREEGRKIPTAAHHAIASLVCSGYIRVIITTNFDRLMENALRERGVEPTIVSSLDALLGAEPLTHSQCYLLKLHGDYKDSRILNTNSELSVYPDSYNHLLDRIFDEHGLIICGWSGEWDDALRSAFLRAPNRRYPTFWMTRSALSERAQELTFHRKAKVVTITSANEFFTTLKQRVETLAERQNQNPLSIELLVHSTKRYQAKPEYRIQLDDLFTQEIERVLLQLDAPNFSAQGQWSQSEFRLRVQQYEAITEALARMAGVLGRWGGDRELRLILDIIRTLYNHAEKIGGGLTVWLNIRSYPAVLVFTAYGLGLTRAQRWQMLHELFAAPWVRKYYECEKVVTTLFLQSWKGVESDIWKQLEGFDRRKTPLSDHLLDVMAEWGTSFLGVASGFELVFERFEILGSLVSFEENDEAAMEKAVTSSDRLAWMPMGRAGWNTTSAAILVQELESTGTIRALLSAGYARNSPRFLQLFLENFKRWQRQMLW